MEAFGVVVIGGGVAGLSAAIFLARAAVPVAVFDRAESSLYRVSQVNNYLGFPDGIRGAELLELGRRQAQRFGALISDENIVTCARAAGGFQITTDARQVEAEHLLLASNQTTDIARSLGLELGGFGHKVLN